MQVFLRKFLKKFLKNFIKMSFSLLKSKVCVSQKNFSSFSTFLALWMNNTLSEVSISPSNTPIMSFW